MKSEKPEKSVRDYLDALVWDGSPRIERWLIDYAGADDTPYVRAVSSAALITAVRRVRQPGCTLDEMLVLEGPQGAGKSRALRTLAIDDDWVTDELPLTQQQFVETLAGKWIVEASELQGMDKRDIAAFKACLSRSSDELRRPHQLKVSRVPRQSVIIGTTNETDGYLRDATGNRRFWSVRVQRFDLERLRADRDQLWAEAAAIEAQGCPVHFAREAA